MPGISTATESFPATLETIRTPSEWDLGPVGLELCYISQRTHVFVQNYDISRYRLTISTSQIYGIWDMGGGKERDTVALKDVYTTWTVAVQRQNWPSDPYSGFSGHLVLIIKSAGPRVSGGVDQRATSRNGLKLDICDDISVLTAALRIVVVSICILSVYTLWITRPRQGFLLCHSVPSQWVQVSSIVVLENRFNFNTKPPRPV